MTRAEILPEILKLSADDQRMIAEAIRERLGASGEKSDEEIRRELDRRIADNEQHPDDEAPWEVARQRLRNTP